jgi:hypothetical protein
MPNCPSPEIVVAETVDYLTEFLEKPHPLFGNLPICPFSKKYRLSHVKWVIGSLNFDYIINYPFGDHFLLWFIDPTGIDIECVRELECKLSETLPDCVVLSGHPQDKFELHGLATRREPYPNIQLFKKSVLRVFQDKLLKTQYYKNFSGEELKQFWGIDG